MSIKLKQSLKMVCLIIALPIVQSLYFVLNFITKNPHPIDTFLDNMIPFNRFFVMPYVFWYAYTFGVLLFFAFKDHKLYLRLLMSIIIGMLICFIVYYIYPTTVSRPEVLGTDVFSKLVRQIYANDRPVNCFPSIHMLDTLLITMFFFKYTKNLGMRFLASTSCVAIYLSTFFIKQHSILDAVASTILAIVLYLIFNNDSIWSRLPVRKLSGYTVPVVSEPSFSNLN